jgi:hypothetical protein
MKKGRTEDMYPHPALKRLLDIIFQKTVKKSPFISGIHTVPDKPGIISG